MRYLKTAITVIISTFCIASSSFAQDSDAKSKTLQPIYKMKGVVKNSSTKKRIYDATITLKGSDGSEETIKTNKRGKYLFYLKEPVNTPIIKPNTTYTITVKKEGYKSTTSTESTKGVEGDKVTFDQDFLLEPKPSE